MEEYKKVFHKIKEAIGNGDWSLHGDDVTRNDLMDYLLYYTNPKITDKGLEVKKLEPCDCPLCGSPTKTQPFAMTHRNVKYLLCFIHLSKKDIANGGEGYVHYEDIKNLCQGSFKHEKGVKKGKGIVFTSYSPMTKAPWDFMKPRVDDNYKPKRDGCFKPTERCYQFLRGKIAVPQRIEILNCDVVRTGGGLVYAAKVKNINWINCLEIYKTF